jgi:hypothetical protein
MKLNCWKFVFSLLVVMIGAGTLATAAATKDQTLTGMVGDALCGREHSMPGTPVDCIRECIGKGGRYSLIVADKVYVLETKDQALLDTLEKESGLRVKITGTNNGKTFLLKTVTPDTP